MAGSVDIYDLGCVGSPFEFNSVGQYAHFSGHENLILSPGLVTMVTTNTPEFERMTRLIR